MRFLILLLMLSIGCNLSAQMQIDGQTLYGNEWIDYDKKYIKVTIDSDGIYRLTSQQLEDNGVPISTINLNQLQMWNYGKLVTFYAAPDNSYVEFYGKRNTTQLDRHLYSDEDNMLNREVSLISDDAAYFVTWGEAIGNLVTLDVTDLTTNTLNPEPYYIHTKYEAYRNVYNKPTLDAGNVRFSTITPSEGFATGSATTNSRQVTLDQLVQNSVNPEIEIRYGGNRFDHNTEIKINDQVVDNVESFKDVVVNKEYALSQSDVQNGVVDVSIRGAASENDRNVLSQITVSYPRTFHSDGASVYTINLDGSTTNRYVEVDGYVEDGDIPLVWDIARSTKIVPQRLVNGKIGFIIKSGGSAEIVMSAGQAEVKNISTREFENFEDDSDYLIISSEKLRAQDNTDWVAEFAAYRSSQTGGSFKPRIANIEQIYDQFGYGVDRHFIALRNYSHWSHTQNEDVQYMFVIGKGLQYWEVRNDSQVAEYDNYFIPTFGYPGSDNLIMCSNEDYVPIYPIGRLAASSSEDVKNYLQKVKDHELNITNPSTIEEREWQKRVLHLSGGDNNIQNALFNYLEIMRDTIENNSFGGKVVTFRKRSTDAISSAASDLIFDQVSNGLSMITFFGHASPGTFDFNLDNVENYDNKGKYPTIMSLGCYSGNIHTSNNLNDAISESFVLAKDKGALSFIAASGTAYIGVQRQFGENFYSQVGGESYGESIGKIVNKVIQKFSGSTSYSYITFYQQLTLHGDPALKFHTFRAPDYTIDSESVVVAPKLIDTYEEEFEVCFDVVNIGKNVVDSMDLTIRHQNPTGGFEFEQTDRILAPSYRSTMCLTIPITSRELVGRNRILVFADSGEEIIEEPSPAAENNNKLIGQDGIEGHSFIILNNSAIPALPEKFAIVNTSVVNLVANTYNALGPKQTYFIELDTTMLFNSPLLQSRKFEDIQSVMQWEVGNLMDKTVYYWRVGSINETTNETVWRESSFVYENGQREGWNQNHYFQFLENELTNLEYVDSSRQLKFVDNVLEIKMDNAIPSNGNIFVEFRVNSSIWNKWVQKKTISSGISLTVFDPVLGRPIVSLKENPLWGSKQDEINRSTYLQFETETIEQREHIMSVLKDSIPQHFIVAVNFLQQDMNNRYNLEDWVSDKDVLGTSILEILEERGAGRIEELIELGPVPYIFVYENNFDSEFKVLSEVLTADLDSDVTALFQIKTLWDEGDIKSQMIGPAQSWDEVVWAAEAMNNDSITLDIIGVDAFGIETVLKDKVEDVSIDISNIDADDYPYIYLKFNSMDPSKTTAQLDMLRVYYEGYHDLSLSPDSHFEWYSDVLNEGEILKLEIDIKNLSTKSSPKTDLIYTVIDDKNNQTTYSAEIEALDENETTREIFTLETVGLSGNYVLQMMANPNENPQEKYYFNNFGLRAFNIKSDSINPLLDVTFDGVQIMNDDIVSSEPFIRIELEDDNRFLLLDDPSAFIMTLTAPDQEQVQLFADDPAINFIPAEEGGDNIAVIEYNPSLELDGNYNLTVQSSDKSGNTSGDLTYEIGFRVYNEEMVSNVFNYPNPFSTSTQFIFTLTGNEEPSNMLIRIMTLTGKVVREITAAELGNIRIGLNKSEYKWDGRDEYGERLGNGTYLYQVITKKLDGSDYDTFSDPTQNNTDYLFKKGFGKLVIMR